MKQYTNKSNAKRAAVNAIVRDRGIAKEDVLTDPDKYFKIEGDKDSGFTIRYQSERVHGVSAEKEAELKEERVAKMDAILKSQPPVPVEKDDDFEEPCRRAVTYNEAGDPVVDGPTLNGDLISVDEAKKAVDMFNNVLTSTSVSSNSKGVKIQKDREERNMVTRPSTGTVCDEIWSACDAIYQNGEGVVPKRKNLLEQLAHINQHTVNTQYYLWRTFNGIVGRA